MPGGVSECDNRESIYLKHLVFMVGRGRRIFMYSQIVLF